MDLKPRVRTALSLDAQLGVDTAFDRADEQVGEMILSSRFELEVELSPTLSFSIAPRLTHLTGIDRQKHDRERLMFDLPETYARWTLGGLHLRVGALIFSWGSSDLIAPSDVLNPVDLRRTAFADPNAAKIPVLAAEAVLRLGPWQLRGVVEPFFTPSRYFLAGWDTSLGLIARAQGLDLPRLGGLIGPSTADRILDQASIVQRPADRPDNATVAARATLTLEEIDWSWTFFHGFESLPRLRLDPDLLFLGGALLEGLNSGQGINLGQPGVFDALGRIQTALAEGRSLYEGSYARRTLFGTDVSWALAPFAIKLDLAYTLRKTLYLQDLRPTGLPWISAVLAAEYARGESFQAELELFTFAAFDLPNDARLLLLEGRRPPPRSFDDGSTRNVVLPGAVAIVRYTIWDGDLGFEVGAITTFARSDLILLPVLRWRLAEHHAVRAGAFISEGRSDSYAGLYSSNDQVFMGYQWSN